MADKIISRLELLLAAEEAIPAKDGAGIIDPKGIDAKARAQAIRDCLRIVREENHE